ncbi:MAG: cation transporter [Coraliomargarita sp.]
MPLVKTTYFVSKLDCASDEQLIRLRLEVLEDVLAVEVNITEKLVHIHHREQFNQLEEHMDRLRLGATLKESVPVDSSKSVSQTTEKKILWWVLGINAVFFVLEMGFGILADSMGLIADSLDMLADAMVYGLSLMAVGTATATKKQVARISGIFQMLLAMLGFAEVVRRFFFGDATPDSQLMIVVSLMALAANIVCLKLIYRARSNEAHMQASAIFTSNDIIVNGGVILAGILVFVLSSQWPDLLVGGIVFAFVMRGAIRIFNLSK